MRKAGLHTIYTIYIQYITLKIDRLYLAHSAMLLNNGAEIALKVYVLYLVTYSATIHHFNSQQNLNSEERSVTMYV